MYAGDTWRKDSKEQRRVDNLVATFIAQGLHAYSVVEELAFIKLMKEGFPRYNLPSRTTFSRSIIPQMYEEERQKIMIVLNQDMPNIESISITTDGWKSRSGDAYLSLTCHYVDVNFELKIFTLSHGLIIERQTGENISTFLLQQADQWGLTSAGRKNVYIVTDGGPNIVSATKRTPWEHRECFAHKLQLVVESAVVQDEPAKEMLKKSRSIVGHYHKSTAATARLKKIQEQMGLMPPKCVIQMVDTRWNSEYYMLERLLVLKRAVNAELATSDHNISTLTSQEWELAEGYLQSLKPFEVATRIMSGDIYPTVSMVIPVLNEIETNLNGLITRYGKNKGVDGKCAQFAKNLLLFTKSKFPVYRDDKIAQIATALDPRFKCILLERHLIEKKLIALAQVKSLASSEVEDLGLTLESEHEACLSTSTDNMWVAFDAAAKEVEGSTTQTTNPASIEVMSYLQEPREAKTVNPYTWWKTANAKYPNLAKVAAEYLPIPATQAASERLFSAAGNIVTARREALSPQHVEQLVFLHKCFQTNKK